MYNSIDSKMIYIKILSYRLSIAKPYTNVGPPHKQKINMKPCIYCVDFKLQPRAWKLQITIAPQIPVWQSTIEHAVFVSLVTLL